MMRSRCQKKLWLYLTLGLNSVAFAKSPAPDVADMVKTIEQRLAPPNTRARYAFTNFRTDGTVMRYEIRFEMKDFDHSRVFFEKPEREKGREVLRLEDNLWTFVPNVGRVVRIADRDSFAGGDFSNADVLRVDWSSKYSVALLKELPNQFIVEMKAKSADAAYAKMRLWIDKKSTQPVQQQFYDSQGSLLKRCLYGAAKNFGSVARPAKLRMENLITKQASELEVVEFVQGATMPDSRFVVDNLGK